MIISASTNYIEPLTRRLSRLCHIPWLRRLKKIKVKLRS